MKNEWFYIRRFKARRKEWHIAIKNANQDSDFTLLEDESGNVIESDYACLSSMIEELSRVEQDVTYEIVHKQDLLF